MGAGCKILGQSSGTCDDQNKCWCSERAISFAEFREMLPSRCTLGLPFCQATCHAIGRRDGTCEYGHGCECTDSRLTPTEFALCAAESTCRTHCQAQGKATGRCNGWQCECLSWSTISGETCAVSLKSNDARSCFPFIPGVPSLNLFG